MKRMGTVESDSVKSARKAKGKLHKACERASETHERTLHGQEVATITCIAVPRVWHFRKSEGSKLFCP